MSRVALVFLILVLLIPLIAILYILFARHRAQQAGLPPPPLSSYNPFRSRSRPTQIYPAPFGVFGWVRSKFQSLRSSRGGGAYAQPLGVHGRRGLDPDEAWDARVGNEADGYGLGGYYEEQELGLRPQSNEGTYAGGNYGGSHGQALPEYGSEEMKRGRSVTRDGNGHASERQKALNERYDEEMERENPFGDQAERSDLRGPSSERIKGEESAEKGQSQKASRDSPTERKSMFRENV